MNSFSLKGAASNSLNGHTVKILRVTNDPIANGQELLTQYGSISISEDNAAFALLLPPGRYDLGGQSLNLYSPRVDIIGLGENPEQQKIYSTVPTGAVVNVLSDKISLKNLSIANNYQFAANPTAEQIEAHSAYSKASSIRDYGLYAPACIYYKYQFILNALNPATQEIEGTLFQNLNNNFDSNNDSNDDSIFPASWGLNVFNTPLYKAIGQNFYIAKFEKQTENMPLGWYYFSKPTNDPSSLNIIACGLEIDATFPWECKTWRTFTSPYVYFNFTFNMWPFKSDYIKLDNIDLVSNDWVLSMSSNSCYVGHFKDVKAGAYSFGGMDGLAIGKYENCQGKMYSFGQAWDTGRLEKHLHLSGEFINCEAEFGSFGQYGLIAGIFQNCKQVNTGRENVGIHSYVEYGTLTGNGSIILDAFSFGTGFLEDQAGIGDNSSIIPQVIWDESVSGDLSNNPFGPTPLGELSTSQENTIVHIVRNQFENIDPDYFYIELPLNKSITGIMLKSFVNTDEFSADATLAVQTGIGWYAGNDLNLMIGRADFTINDVNTNLLNKMSNVTSIQNSPLTFRLQYPGGATNMEIELRLN